MDLIFREAVMVEKEQRKEQRGVAIMDGNLYKTVSISQGFQTKIID
jgi:predicted PolB exonuclease-like 3'-5' exonuclease